jgi:GH24 family phage-related lysozyme (muramidase)
MTATHVSARGRALIKQFEGFRADAYQDVVGVWTIGYGFTRGVQPGQHMTAQQAEARLITELLGYEQAVLGGCTREPNQNQMDAMCSLAWNIGVGGFLRSTVLKAHNRGDAQSASRAFGLWNKAGGREWAGLTRRRAAEAALYLEPVPVRRLASRVTLPLELRPGTGMVGRASRVAPPAPAPAPPPSPPPTTPPCGAKPAATASSSSPARTTRSPA